MGEIKSAYERAMERVAGIGKASKEETLKWKNAPEGQRLAAQYLSEESNLAAELDKYGDEARAFVVEGVQEVLLRNIDLPVDDVARNKSKRSMDGIRIMKKDKSALENAYSKMRRVFEHYEQDGEQQKRQARESLKRSFEARIQQALQQQGGLPPGARIDVESQPQFQEEWHRVLAQLDSQYYTLLEEYKQEIVGIR